MTLGRSWVLLIVVAGMERFVFKGIASNLVMYLTDVMKMSNSSAARTVNSWYGFTSMFPLVVAPLVDSYWDHYSTIIASSFVYLLGILALISTPFNKQKPSSLSLFLSLYLISLGQGGYNPSLQAFGVNLFKSQDELLTVKNDHDHNKSRFFKWWCFGVCSGSLLGVSVMPNVQDLVGWGPGFMVPAIVMVLSMILFWCGGRFCSYNQDKNIEITVTSFKKMVKAIKHSMSKIRLKSDEKAHIMDIELEKNPLCLKDDVINECSSESENINHLLRITKIVLRLLLIWTTLLMFAVIFQQPATFFIKQGITMKRNIGKTYNLPPATLQTAITISIILLMPIYDSIFIPFTRRILRNEKGITTRQRIGIGMLFSVVAMALAAAVESKRLEESSRSRSRSRSGRLSIFWLLPQYILLGISDIFTVVGMQEFFYGEIPATMRTTGIAMYTSVFGVGSFLSALMVFLEGAWECVLK